MGEPTKILLDESDLPRRWYNLLADLPSPPPPVLHPGTKEPVGPDDLAPLFPGDLIAQEVTAERYVDIPEEVLEVYRLWRPSPLYRAHRLEKALGTPAKIFYKYEGVSPAGSHKPNTAVPQAYYNALAGVRRLTTETGAGQWGTALAFACSQFGLDCEVWQVRASYDQKPYRKAMIETFGGVVHPSPSELTEAGRAALAKDGGSPGSLGIAISEAVEVAAGDPTTNYALGSVLNHVLLHQTVIGEEALAQFAKVGLTPDLIVGCTGGGSNFAGLAFPFLREKLSGRMDVAVRAVEPASCPSLTKGVYAYDFGDTAGMTPLMKMHTLGHDFVPARSTRADCATTGCPRCCPTSTNSVCSRPRPERSASASRRGSGSPVPKALCPHPNPPTRLPRASRKPCAAGKPARRRSSSPRSAVTATSTWQPTPPT
ncbi:TrpB-like pyridoxal phosphate-dependent enzyme [Actinopolymorpha singaporensis]|uniref:tryptophan synthase n=1 Tax=Actinopolymorpha singaporensis TaxID=117157 RepID=A0A1H1QAS5_9ACTN|nr:TrpB-like pyridoxal phosphate-dependent enzyme [Actinopolymorpha singaporensis]SDS20556.1 tryptophan synthase beta chain [Actinopolymorpha singaporensis]